MEQAFLASGGAFRDFRIGDLFHIGTGSLIDAKALTSGKIKRISVKSDNNGIIGCYQTEGMKQARHFENFISINFFGGVFYHPYKASVEMKVHTLSLKEHSFTRNTGLYIASLLSKSLSGLFSYGNQLSSSLLANGDFFIKLPFSNGKIAFDFMENFVYELQASRLRELQAYLKATGLSDYILTADEERVLANLETVEWGVFNLENLFGNAMRGKRLKSADRISGNLPFVTAGEADTGISAFIGNQVDIFPKNTVTIDMFGSAKYRNYQYGADDHIAVVHCDDLEKHAAIFLTTAIHKVANAGQFSYARNFYAKDADALNISLPIQNGKPDFTLMATLGKAIEKLVIADVVKYAEREIAAYKKVIQ